MRLAPSWMVFAAVFGILPASACTAPRDLPTDETDGSDTPGPAPKVCERGVIRCSGDGASVQECDGKRYVQKISCDVPSGQVCRGSRCVGPCDDLPSGSAGCGFYIANMWSTSLVGDLGIVASNTSNDRSAEVTLSDANGVIGTQTAPPGGLVIFRVDHFRNKLSETELGAKGFYLRATSPVAAYLFHPIDAAQVFSGSATLLLPEHDMARDYFAVSYTYNADLMTTPAQGQGFLVVVGISDGTQIEVKVPVATAAGAGVPALKPGDTFRTTLDRLQVLELMQESSHEDISGATVKASAPVAVFGGAGGVTIPTTALGGNHLGVQMFPLQAWGKRYVASKLKQRNASDHDYYRILASVDNTHVSFDGPGVPGPQTLLRGAFFEFDTDADFEITADQPIVVLQYMPAWGNLSGTFNRSDFPDGAPPGCPFGDDNVQCLGDANMTPLAPVEQYRSDYIFYVPQTYTYDYITVTAPIGAALMLDGNPVTDGLRAIGSGALGRVILRLQPGNHRITGDVPFGLLSYGYAYATSYSYPGGLNLETINPIPPG